MCNFTHRYGYWIISIQKMDGSESGQMGLENNNWAYFDVCLSWTMWNHAKINDFKTLTCCEQEAIFVTQNLLPQICRLNYFNHQIYLSYHTVTVSQIPCSLLECDLLTFDHLWLPLFTLRSLMFIAQANKLKTNKKEEHWGSHSRCPRITNFIQISIP